MHLPIRVQNKRDVPHLSIARPLLELDTKLFKAFAGSLDVFDGDGDVSKPASGV
jgi:hypothetical protein